MLRLSAIVPATADAPTLARCTAALRSGPDPADEVIVISEPRGARPARARNIGAAQATGDVLVFVDADVEVHPDALPRLRSSFAADGDLAAVFGSYDDTPGAPGVVSGFRNLLHHHVHQQASGPATTFWTGLGAVRREALERIGGFDESIDFMEDIDLGMRLSAAGNRIELDPAVQGKHLKPWSLWTMIHTDFNGRGIPWIVLLLRHRNSLDALNLGWRHRLSAGASIVGIGALLLRRPVIAGAAAGALIALNHSFYGLLLRRRGPVDAAAGVPLHALHHLAGAAAVPAGILRYVRERRGETK